MARQHASGERRRGVRRARPSRRQLKAVAIGFIAGMGGGLVSLGGGTLVVPLLTGWVKLDQLNARGTALAVSIVSALTGTVVYARAGQVDWEIVLWTGLAAMVTAPLAVRLSVHWSTRALRTAFGIVVTIGGLILIGKSLFVMHGFARSWPVPFMALTGTITGVVAGLVGVSGGPVLAPMFVLGLAVPQQLAQGCSLAARLPSSLSGSWQNWRQRNIDVTLLPGLVVGAVTGGIVGGRIALALPGATLRIVFGVALVLLGVAYSRGGRRAARGAADSPGAEGR